MNVIVVGGGVIGCSVAYFLTRAGQTVTIIERRHIGAGASSAAAGMLAPLAEAGEPGPFQSLALDGLVAFRQHAQEIIHESGIDFEFRKDGILRVAETAEQAATLQSMLNRTAAPVVEAQWLGAKALRQMEPELAPHLRGAIFSAEESHVNPQRLTVALATAAVRRGARLIEGCTAQSLEVDGDDVRAIQTSYGRLDGDLFICACGAWTSLWDARLPAPAPVVPIRGQMAALSGTPVPIRHIIYSHQGYLVPKADGSIYVGATEEPEAGYNDGVTAAGLQWLLTSAIRLVPSLSNATYLRSWAGLRPGSADRLPLIGPLPGFRNSILATGHFRNGILLSLITGQLVTRLALDGRTPRELEPFLPDRFLPRV